MHSSLKSWTDEIDKKNFILIDIDNISANFWEKFQIHPKIESYLDKFYLSNKADIKSLLKLPGNLILKFIKIGIQSKSDFPSKLFAKYIKIRIRSPDDEFSNIIHGSQNHEEINVYNWNWISK
jgi:hypothetical protein